MAAVDTSPVTREELRKWRLTRRLTQVEAERWWFGHDNEGRTWRKYELGERGIPAPLSQRIAAMRRTGRKRGTGGRLDSSPLV